MGEHDKNNHWLALHQYHHKPEINECHLEGARGKVVNLEYCIS